MFMGASAVSPHFPQQREASRGGLHPPRFLCGKGFGLGVGVGEPTGVQQCVVPACIG
jgi:hypothetical protein